MIVSRMLLHTRSFVRYVRNEANELESRRPFDSSFCVTPPQLITLPTRSPQRPCHSGWIASSGSDELLLEVYCEVVDLDGEKPVIAKSRPSTTKYLSQGRAARKPWLDGAGTYLRRGAYYLVYGGADMP